MRLKIVEDGSTMELKTGPEHVEALTAFLEEHCDPITPSEFYRQARAPKDKTEDEFVVQTTIDELEQAIAELKARNAVPSGLSLEEKAEIDKAFEEAQANKGAVVFKP